jgi:GT2 family glycosyltransferase
MKMLADVVAVVAAREDGLRATSEMLGHLRDYVRDQLPPTTIEATADLVAQVEGMWRIDARSFYVEGWLADRKGGLSSLRLISPEGLTVDLLGRLFRYRRPDVSEFLGMAASEPLGFIVLVSLPHDSVMRAGWILQGEALDGTGFETRISDVVDDPVSSRAILLDDLSHEYPVGGTLLRDHIGPAVSRIQQRLAASVEIASIDQHGVAPTNADVSVIVPLYQRVEFLEYQLAQFVHDADLGGADLIYVLDSPEDGPYLRRFAQHLHSLYGVPFRLVALSESGGFSVVNNLAATLARGRLLLLLNSDVMPRKPGWLAHMVEFYDANPAIGALAPKLLYEDDSIQHAGLFFQRSPDTPSWTNEHYYKGLHRTFPAANVARAVDAVTGACLMIATDLYKSLGGLSGVYVRGDYEDSDLCLRLRELGRESWYLPEVELYHLEGQSYPSAERERTTRYNQLLHAERWRRTLPELEQT